MPRTSGFVTAWQTGPPWPHAAARTGGLLPLVNGPELQQWVREVAVDAVLVVPAVVVAVGPVRGRGREVDEAEHVVIDVVDHVENERVDDELVPPGPPGRNEEDIQHGRANGASRNEPTVAWTPPASLRTGVPGQSCPCSCPLARDSGRPTAATTS